MIRKVFSLTTPFQILIVEDNSPDGTAGIVKTLQKEFPQQLHILERKGKLGLGTAYLTKNNPSSLDLTIGLILGIPGAIGTGFSIYKVTKPPVYKLDEYYIRTKKGSW